MLQELAAQTGAAAWAIGSMLFFLAVFVAVVVWVVLKRPEEMQARARLPLEGEDGIRDRGSGIGDQGSGIGGQGARRPDSGTLSPRP
jgi:hypothetical protein